MKQFLSCLAIIISTNVNAQSRAIQETRELLIPASAPMIKNTASRLIAEVYTKHNAVAWQVTDSAYLKYSPGRGYDTRRKDWNYDVRTNCSLANAQYKQLDRMTNTYDAAGNLTRQDLDVWNGSMWKPFAHTYYTYNAHGLIATITYYSYPAGQMVPDYRHTYTYNTQGRETMKLVEAWDVSTHTILENHSRFTTSYTPTGLPLVDLSEGWDPGTQSFFFSYRTTHRYDANNREINSLKEGYGGVWVPTDSFTYLNDAQGRRIEETHLMNLAPWKGANKYTYSYDVNGNLLARTMMAPNGPAGAPFINYGQHVYTYNSHNQVETYALLTWKATIGQFVPDINSPGARYYYEQYQTGVDDEEKPQHAVSIYPLPATGQLNIHRQQAGDKPAVATLTDVSGRPVGNWLLFAPTETIGVSHIARGNYLLIVKDGEERNVQRVILQ